MYEYIKRTDAINEVNRGDLLVGNCAEWAKEIIWRTPYADVAEVKRGRWVKNKKHFGNIKAITYNCSNCHFGVDKRSKFCPDCGAKMCEENYHGRIY